MREPSNMELYQEIERLRGEIKKINVQDKSYQEYINSLTQLAIAQKCGAISPELFINLVGRIYTSNATNIKKWSPKQRENAAELMREMKEVHKSLTNKDETTRQ